MNPECHEVEVLVSLRAAGAGGELSPAEAGRLDAHLERCPACRQALERGRELMDLVRLPAPDAAEDLALADLPARALAELRRRDRRRGLARRVMAAAAGMAVAAGLVLALLSPALFRGRGPELPGLASPAATQVAWEEPDMDALWNASAIVEYGSASSTDATMTDAVLAAYDAGDGSY